MHVQRTQQKLLSKIERLTDGLGSHRERAAQIEAEYKEIVAVMTKVREEVDQTNELVIELQIGYTIYMTTGDPNRMIKALRRFDEGLGSEVAHQMGVTDVQLPARDDAEGKDEAL